jgi:hypothetical protein
MVQMGLIVQMGAPPEVALSNEQNEKLAVAVNNVRRHFPALALTQKQEDIVALCMVAGTIGWTQFGAYQRRKMVEKKASAAPAEPAPMGFTPFVQGHAA